MSKQLLKHAVLCCVSLLMATAMQAQTAISGKVVDSAGEPLIGASVTLKSSTNQGTVSDLDGKFTLQARAGSTLVVSYIGFLSKEVQASQDMIVVLQEENNTLNDVVVIGYGSVKRKDATGSLETLTADPKLKGVAPNATDMLVGKISGVNVTTSGGSATGGASIRIRGGSSLSASNTPLIIIDGVYLDGGGVGGVGNVLSSINPNDIEDFTVLKDASATAIYGSRASNGVILITTKKGKSGKIKVTYDGNVSVANKKKTVDVLNGDEFRNLIQTTFAGLSNEAAAVGKLGTENTDWQGQLFRSAVTTDHAVSVYGAVKDFMPYRVSMGYTNNNGILKTDHMERYTAGFSTTPSFFDNHLRLNINAKYMHSKSRFANAGAIGTAIVMDPTQPVYADPSTPQGQYGGYWAWIGDDNKLIGVSTKNPVSMLMQHNDLADADNFIGNAQFDYDFFYIKGLRATLNLSLDYSHSSGTTDDPYDAQISAYTLGYHNDWTQTRRNQMLDFYMTYARDLKSIRSHFDVMGGYSWQRYWMHSPFHRIAQFQYDNSGALVPFQEVSGDNPTQHYIVSFFGRFNYSLMDRYLMTFTIRDDGSSRFAKQNHWGVFPSVAFAWRIIEEPWLKKQNVLSNLKLRLGWGKTGQQDINQGDYPFLGSYYFNINSQSMYYRNGAWSYLLQPNAYNPDLKWETTSTYNIGLDFGFLKNRISGSIDAYWRKTTDLINAEAKQPAGANFAEYVAANIGDLENKGIELSLNTIPVQTKDWTWELGANVSWNQNKILKLNNGDGTEATQRRFFGTAGDGSQNLKVHMVGQPAGMWYMYEQVYDEAGKPIEGVFVDQNNDGVINEKDLHLYHKSTPDVTVGLNSKLQWRNWDFDIAGHGAFGNWIYNSMGGGEMSPARLFANLFLTNRTVESLYSNFQTNKVLSDYYVRNASYFRIDNITLGYSFPSIGSLKTSGRVYATVQNPFVITSYSGLDPEIDGGYDNSFYPRPITFLLGVNLNF